MKKTLIPKLIFGYVLFVVLGFIILCTFTQHAITHYAENREAQQLYRESVQIASGYADNYNKYSFSLQDFQKQMQSLGEYLSAQIWIMDNQGNILFDSTDESVGKNAANANYKTLKGFNTSDFGNRYYMTGNFYGSFSEKNLTVFSPITSNYRIHSYVMIHKTVSSITQNANGFMNIVFYTIEFVFLTALFLLLLFAHGFYRPLHRLTIVSESYAKGNFEPRTQIHRNDELGYLANTMDYMANELDTLEEDQRKFISNVSHDFRSPLTSIKGYIEAMLDGTIPPELQNKYLNIILFETERLTKLTQGILDLNRFGQHRGMMLDLTDFDINRMIKTTILTFEGTCSAKGLSFDLVLTGQKLYVHGDMSKIQQVLYNLIDNATKFSHNDASIKIETSIKNEKVLISVKDSGIGIPAESIKKIWDRFYKTDLSRGKDKRGTGLGLAIVKEIIQAHNEHINVISTEGVGTEFIFTLPLGKKRSTVLKSTVLLFLVYRKFLIFSIIYASIHLRIHAFLIERLFIFFCYKIFPQQICFKSVSFGCHNPQIDTQLLPRSCLCFGLLYIFFLLLRHLIFHLTGNRTRTGINRGIILRILLNCLFRCHQIRIL